MLNLTEWREFTEAEERRIVEKLEETNPCSEDYYYGLKNLFMIEDLIGGFDAGSVAATVKETPNIAPRPKPVPAEAEPAPAETEAETETEAPAPETEHPAEPESPFYTKEDVRKALAEAKSSGRLDLPSFIKRFNNAAKLSEIPESMYGDVMAQLREELQ